MSKRILRPVISSFRPGFTPSFNATFVGGF
jgi:hypothetical protein